MNSFSFRDSTRKIPRSANIFPVLLLLFLRVIVTISAVDPSSGTDFGDDDDKHPVCGTVRTFTSTGENLVELREGLALSPEKYKLVYSGKLKNATFFPFTNRSCVIRACGFKQFGNTSYEGFIGSDCDYADCQIFHQISQAPRIFDERYNTSSIGCSCQKRVEDCLYNCHKRAKEQINNWGANGCAILYQELACNNCYFQPITLSIGQNYSTDNSHHIRSILIREQCTVKQYIPALKRMWRFANVSQPIIHYHYFPIESTMNTSFISEPEHFHCVCGEAPPSTPAPPTRRPPTPAPLQPTHTPVRIVMVVGGLSIIAVVIIITTIVVVTWRRRKSRLLNNFEHLEEEEDGIQNEPSDERDTTTNQVKRKTTDASVQVQDHKRFTFQLLTELFQKTCGDGTTRYILSREKFQVLREKLGEGSFATVKKGVLLIENGEEVKVAVKTMKERPSIDNDMNREITSFIREIKAFVTIGDGHENIVKFFGYCCDIEKDTIYILTELCEGGSLLNFLKEKMRPKYFEVKQVTGGYCIDHGSRLVSSLAAKNSLTKEDFREFMRICKEIANGLVFLNSMGIIHVDIACRNILFRSDGGTIKICDFGLSRKCANGSNVATSVLQDIPFHSIVPENLDPKEPKQASLFMDIWSYACTVWEIFSMGDCLYLQNIVSVLSKEECHPKPELAPDIVYEKILECWNKTPKERPSFQTLYDFFKDMEENSTHYSSYLGEENQG